MAEKRIKIQLTLPKDIVEKVEKEISDNFMSMSFWFEKITRQYFEEQKKNFPSYEKESYRARYMNAYLESLRRSK